MLTEKRSNGGTRSRLIENYSFLLASRQNNDFGTLKEASYLKKKKDEITIRSSAAEYLTYVASVGDQ